MSSKIILSAVVYICLGVPALSVLVFHKRPPPRPFGFPSGRFIIPGKSMKHTRLHLMPVPMPHAGHFLPRISHKPFKFVKHGPAHPLLLHKMKKLPRIAFPRSMPFRSRFGNSRRGSYRSKSIRPAGYGRTFAPRIPNFRRQGGYSKQKVGQPGRIPELFGRGGATSGVQRKGYGNRPGLTYSNTRTAYVSAFPRVNPVGGMAVGQKNEQQNSAGFHGGHFRHGFRTLNDVDIFDDMFDDRFDKGFEIDIKDYDMRDTDRDYGMRDTDRDFKESLTVPEIFGKQSGVSQPMNSGMVQQPTRSNGYYDKRGKQNTSPGVFGLREDELDNIKTLSMANADSEHNPFNIQPGFLQGNTGVNVGGGIGLLQTFDDRGENIFEDNDKVNPLSVNINFNTINPFTNNKDNHGSLLSVLPIEPSSGHMDDQIIEADTVGFHEGVSQAGTHFVTHKGDTDDTKTVASDLTSHGVPINNHIDGLELLGHSHPNMLAARRFSEDEKDHTLHNVQSPNIQALPFNPHSDENMDIKDSVPEEIDEGTLAMLGIDPRTLGAGMLNEQFGMQSSLTTSSSTLPAHFPLHQPAQMPPGTSMNIHNPVSFPATSFNQPSSIPSALPFTPSSSHNPRQSLFVPSTPVSPIQPSSATWGINSPMFPDIPMNVDVFQDFGLLDNQDKRPTSNVDHSAHVPMQQDMSPLQFAGADSQIDDLSFLSQIPSVDDLAFGTDQFNVQGQ